MQIYLTSMDKRDSEVHSLSCTLQIMYYVPAFSVYAVPEGIGLNFFSFRHITYVKYASLRYNLIAMLFFFAFEIPHVGTTWLNYVLPLSAAAGALLVLLVRDEYRRSRVDESLAREEKDDDDNDVAEEPEDEEDVHIVIRGKLRLVVN